MTKKDNHKVRWELTAGIGECGYFGKTTKKPKDVTCKICITWHKKNYPGIQNKAIKKT